MARDFTGRHLYYGLAPTAVGIVAFVLLLGVYKNPVADVAMILLGGIIGVEGLGLVLNWRGETRNIVDILRAEDNPSVLSQLPLYAYRFFGLFCLAASVAAIANGLRFLI